MIVNEHWRNLFMGFIIVLLIIAGVGYGISWLIEELKRKMGEDEYRKFQQESYQKSIEKEKAKKFNNYNIECPVCHSKNVRSIGNLERTTSVTMLGLASSKIGKQYKCTNCHHKF